MTGSEATPSSPATGGPTPTMAGGPNAAYQAGVASFYWYVRNAKNSRTKYQISECVVLGITTAVPIAGLLSPSDARVAGVIGAVATGLAGLRLVFHWRDNWARFSGSCAALKAEIRLYDAGVEPYDDSATRDSSPE